MMEGKEKKYCYEYPRPSVTSDCVIFGFDGSELKILLIERALEPYKGYWALPGGFMRMDESIEQCASRELHEETNISDVYLEQLQVFSRPDRDPRGRVVTVAFIALVRPGDFKVAGGDDAARAAWFGADMLPPLAFDHQEIVDAARARLREILRVRPVAFNLLERTFSVDELRKVYEAVNGTVYDRRNFQRKLMQSNLVEEDMEAPCAAEVCEASMPYDACPLPEETSCRRLMVDSDIRDCETPPTACEATRSERETKQRRPKRNRLFRLRRSRRCDSETTRDDAERDEGSIKDLFNF